MAAEAAAAAAAAAAAVVETLVGQVKIPRAS